MKTYIIIIPDCTHPYARFDFESNDWQSTNELSKAWTVDETTAYEAACNFRENFGIDQGTFAITATLLSEEIEDQAEYVLRVLTYSQEVGGGVVIKSCNTEINGELVVPDTIDGLPVTRIESWAFQGCTGLTSVTLPSSITKIDSSAFDGCTGLKSATLPSSLTAIGYWAFGGCTGLTSVTLPSSLTEIGYAAFADCTGLKAITVDIANSTYSSNDGVLFNKAQTSLIAFPGGKTGACSIPNSITSIGDAAFEGCTGLKTVTLPSSLTTIGNHAFYKCTGLTSVTLPSSITAIGEGTFGGCTGLKTVTLPSSITTIGHGAFRGCTLLKTVTLPSSLTTIGNHAFYGCTALKTITLPNSLTAIGQGAFSGCTVLTKSPTV